MTSAPLAEDVRLAGIAGQTPFLRFDRPELEGTKLILRAKAADDGLRQRLSPLSPLGYLYRHGPPDEPEVDMTFSAGHYDTAGQVWVFSGDISGIVGITQPLAPDER